MNISVIIPAFNEELYLPVTIESVRHIPEISEIVVVDDGSSDKTTHVARSYADVVLTLPKNMGKGEALRRGVSCSTGDFLLFLDSDLARSAVLARFLLRPVLKGQADMSVAVFPPTKVKAGFGCVKGLARWGIYSLTGYRTSAPLSGQRAMTRNAATTINSWSGRFGIEVGMTIDIVRAGLRIMEVPLPFAHRETGRNWSGFMHRGKQFWDVGRILGQKWRFQKC